MRFSTSLPAIGIATVIALAGLTTLPAPVAATDPVPTPTPSPEPSATPTPDPSASTNPTVSPEPSATVDPSASPQPSASPATEPPTTVTAPSSTTIALSWAQRVRERYLQAARVAVRQRHDRYVSGATGPNAFDCSGLVRFAYRQAGISGRLGGGHSARAMLAWARRHDRTRRHHGRVGDVVIWGNGAHAGIYLGNGRAISALNPRQDIRITGIHALGDSFTTFISTRP